MKFVIMLDSNVHHFEGRSYVPKCIDDLNQDYYQIQNNKKGTVVDYPESTSIESIHMCLECLRLRK